MTANSNARPFPPYLILSFLLIVLLISLGVADDLNHAAATQAEIEKVISIHNNKIRLVHEMRSAVRERVINLNTLLLHEDPFVAEQAYAHFLEWGNRFIAGRTQLRSLLEGEEEKALLDTLRQSSIEGAAIIERAVALAREGDNRLSREALFTEVVPVQVKMAESAERLLDYYMEEMNRQMVLTQQQNATWMGRVVLLGGAMIIIVVTIAIYVVRRFRRDSQGLEAAVDARTQELQSTAEQLNAVQRVAKLGHWEWDIPSGGLRWSDEIFRIFGVEPGAYEPTYEAFLQAVHPDDREKLTAGVNAAVSGEQEYSLEHRVVHPDGTQRVVHERGVVSCHDDGSPLRMLGTVHDITERKAMEQELQLAASVYHNTGDGIMITDDECKIIDVNEAFSELFGHDRAELLGQNPRLLRSGRHDESFFQQFWESLNSSGQWQGEIWDRHKSGEVIPLWLTVNAVRDENNSLTSYVALFRDITKSKETEQQLWQIAHHDALTGLPNRSLMYGRLQLAMEQADREKSAMALMLIDLDGFKQVNDSLGHGAGDEVLVRVAATLNNLVRESDTVVRYAGDEFVVVLKGLYQRDAITSIADAMIAEISGPMEVEGETVKIGASIGVVIYPTNAYDADSLIARADEAMYRAKEAGKGCCRFYDD